MKSSIKTTAVSHTRNRRQFLLGLVTATAAVTQLPALAMAASRNESSLQPSAEDRMAIIELMALYAWNYDAGDANGFAQTFTEDGVLEIFGQERARGREAIAAFISTAFEKRGEEGWQHLTDHHIFRDVEQDRCSVYSYYLMPISDKNGANVQTRAMGYYVSDCRRIDGQWLFAKRAVFRWDSTKPWEK